MRIQVHAISDVGSIRARNEDMVLVENELLRDDAKEYEFNLDALEAPTLIAVADGLGGHNGGSFASELVLMEMSKAIKELENGLLVTELKKSLKEKITSVHSVVNEEGVIDPSKSGMGSTFIGLLFYGKSIFYINIGDSRLYRFRDGILSQFSRDHSLMAMTNDPGAPRHILMNSFGAGANIFFDFENISNRVMDNDTLILCSDGLTTELADDEIESLLAVSADPHSLVEAAKQKEGRDNISVIVIRCTGA